MIHNKAGSLLYTQNGGLPLSLVKHDIYHQLIELSSNRRRVEEPLPSEKGSQGWEKASNFAGQSGGYMLALQTCIAKLRPCRTYIKTKLQL